MKRLTREEVERFARGDADELEEVVLADSEYLSWVEEIWAQELPRDLRPGVVRALQIEAALMDGLAALVDLGGAYANAIVTYLGASLDEPTEDEP